MLPILTNPILLPEPTQFKVLGEKESVDIPKTDKACAAVNS